MVDWRESPLIQIRALVHSLYRYHKSNGRFSILILRATIMPDCRISKVIRLAVAIMGLVSASAGAAEKIDFDEIPADDKVGNASGICPAKFYKHRGVVISTVRGRGDATAGKSMTLTNVYAGFEVIGGPSQPAISLPNFVIPIGGTKNGCLLMEFTRPVTRVSVTTDQFTPENKDRVRLIALKKSQGNTYEVLIVDEKDDDALTAPDNLLEVQSATPFQYALFQCLTEREGIDDLSFDLVPVDDSK
jgi:hypothetical protein